ncbi:tRNA (guanosine(37)-N1)-methyltransferase TrmD [bacterium]|nr:tRNA (guanosine(37)-N1)-methyltransferase TrmD [bacterium]
MIIDVITPFPNLIQGAFQESILKRAQNRGLVKVTLWDLRDFTSDKHHTVDDYPYGGGAGMILKPEPIFLAVKEIRGKHSDTTPDIILMTPQGKTYTQEKARLFSRQEHLIFLCGHYRGVDQRVIDALVTEEISIGDYILSGGELAAAVVIDSVIRLLPDVLNNTDSAEGDSFTCGMLDYPHYTRPEIFQDMPVPDVLLSGHHENIRKWRHEQALENTKKRRPDLLNNNEEAQDSSD